MNIQEARKLCGYIKRDVFSGDISELMRNINDICEIMEFLLNHIEHTTKTTGIRVPEIFVDDKPGFDGIQRRRRGNAGDLE